MNADMILPDAMNPCGKFWFETKAEAKDVMASMLPDPNRGPEWKLNVYHCYNCDGFHIGHTRVRQ